MSLMIDILPLNTVEIMTMVNFKHLDEEKLLENGEVLKQKSGYTHSFTDELYEIFEKCEITPPKDILDIYGEYYINIFEYNKWLKSEIHQSKKLSEKELESFNLLAPYFYKYYFTLKGYEENFNVVKRALMEEWDFKKREEELKKVLKKLDEELSFEKKIEKNRLMKFMEKIGLVEVEKKKFRYEIYEQIESAFVFFQKDFSYFLDIDKKINEFAKKNSKIIATLIQRFQDLGVDSRKEVTPNYDFYNFHLRYLGELKVRIDEE